MVFFTTLNIKNLTVDILANLKVPYNFFYFPD